MDRFAANKYVHLKLSENLVKLFTFFHITVEFWGARKKQVCWMQETGVVSLVTVLICETSPTESIKHLFI